MCARALGCCGDIFRPILSCPILVEGDPKAPFSIATTARCRGGRYSFPGIAILNLDPYLIMLSFQQEALNTIF